MKVLSVASECAPLLKTGGLADVAGALPAALGPHGVDMRVILPAYRPLRDLLGATAEVMVWDDLFGGPATLHELDDHFLLDAPHLYDRDGGPYLAPDRTDWDDNPQRFAALCRAAIRVAGEGAGDFRPDVLHGHDWQAGLMPYYAAREGLPQPTVMTIHNVAFAGLCDATMMEILGVDPADFTPDGVEFWGRLSLLKAGLTTAHAITTVSPTYADELKTPHFGGGLDGLFRARGDALLGILNGIDTEAWNPATDPHVPPFKTLRQKARAKAALRKRFDLPDTNGPLAVVVSRLTHQKGLDLLLGALPEFLTAGGQLILLGSGDDILEDAFRQTAETHPGVGVKIGYDEALSHRIVAGGDAILVPSRFEPCGLTQLYGLRYGTIPVVARTGGLADTVIDANAAALTAGVATGLQHAPDDPGALAAALRRLAKLHADAPTWATMVKRAMRHPVGWDTSAAAYAALYESLAAAP